MFTGIVEDTGRIERQSSGTDGGQSFVIASNFEPDSLALGDSICTNGVCLTVTELQGSTFSVDAGPETLKRTTLGTLTVGQRVNLERSVTLQTRLGGHLVMGHVDGLGSVRAIRKDENSHRLEVELPPELARMAVAQGSITINGVSLTVAESDAKSFSVMVIPHTWDVTTLADLKPGLHVNIEIDVIIRYVDALLKPVRGQDGLTPQFLARFGFPLGGRD